jgi:hypothetical protein
MDTPGAQRSRTVHPRPAHRPGVEFTQWRTRMAKSYYSIVLDHSAADVWAVIRPFDHYAWAGVEGATVIEEGRAGDQVGAVRRVSMGEKVLRQQLDRKSTRLNSSHHG